MPFAGHPTLDSARARLDGGGVLDDACLKQIVAAFGIGRDRVYFPRPSGYG
ncbi:hypothetical protein ABT150_48795 [Streptomyces mirabilis]|uniref:hypothetical protein n=1 Tax=Streptomyces mirabilis TaxID=68239 RepID=UPI00331B0B2E